MAKDFKLVLSFLVTAMFFTSCYRDKSAAAEYSKTIELNDSLNTISIENKSSLPVTFSLNINGIFPLYFENISNLIKLIMLNFEDL